MGHSAKRPGHSRVNAQNLGHDGGAGLQPEVHFNPPALEPSTGHAPPLFAFFLIPGRPWRPGASVCPDLVLRQAQSLPPRRRGMRPTGMTVDGAADSARRPCSDCPPHGWVGVRNVFAVVPVTPGIFSVSPWHSGKVVRV